MNLKNNTKLLSLTIAAGLVLFLFLLPRTVVSKKSTQEQSMVEESTKEIEENSSAHLDLDENTLKEVEKINLLLKISLMMK